MVLGVGMGMGKDEGCDGRCFLTGMLERFVKKPLSATKKR